MINRFFPACAWAWPSAGLDQLVCAAISPDKSIALTSAQYWLCHNDIDRVAFREHRLLAAVSARLGSALARQAAYPRLIGLQRQLWTRSRMAMAEAAPILKVMHEHRIRVMLLKGGARIAARPTDQQSRVSHDLDILVEASHFRKALDVLFDAGWVPASGESSLSIKSRADSIRSMNFFHQRFGDIDLHQWAYGRSSPITKANVALWDESTLGDFFGSPVYVPSATDRLALAIHHSALDAHTHSDWLVDCAQLVTDTTVDWIRLLELLRQLRAIVAAQIVFSYLSVRIGLAVPTDFLRKLMVDSSTGWLQRIGDLLQAKPRANWSLVSRIARGIVKQSRLLGERSEVVQPMVNRGAVSRLPKIKQLSLSTSFVLHQWATKDSGTWHFQIDLAVNLPAKARRMEFELNTDTQHLLRLRARSLWRRSGFALIRFFGEVNHEGAETNLRIEARPGRALRGGESQAELERYAPIAFSVLPSTHLFSVKS